MQFPESTLKGKISLKTRVARYWLLGVLAGLLLLFWVIILKNIPAGFYELGGDSAQYIILAESLAKGAGYHALNYPGSPFFYHYPPLFPLILSPVVYFFGRNFFLMHLVTACFGFICLLPLYKILEKYAAKNVVFLVLIFLITNRTFIVCSAANILSDVPYLCLSLLTLWPAAGYIKSENWFNRQAGLTVLGLILCYFSRYAGISLFLALMTALSFFGGAKRFKKVFFVGAVFLTVFGAWQLIGKTLNPRAVSQYFSSQVLLIDPYRPFLGTLCEHPGAIFLRFIQGAQLYADQSAAYLFAYSHYQNNALPVLTVVLYCGLVFLGLAINFCRDKSSPVSYYFLIYLFMVILWPFSAESERFGLAILPFMIFYFFTAVEKILALLPAKSAALAMTALATGLIVMNLLVLPLRPEGYPDLPLPSKHFVDLNIWAAGNLDKSQIIISRKPAFTYLYTGNQALVYPFSGDPEKIKRFVAQSRAGYIMVDEFSSASRQYLWPFVEKYHRDLKLIRLIGSSGILAVIKNDSWLEHKR